MELTLPVPRRFDFLRTVLSHGWAFLPPFEFDRDSMVLRRVLSLPGRRPLTAAFIGSPSGLRVEVEQARMSSRATDDLAEQVAVIFGLRVDLEPFYRATARDPEWRWIGRAGAGRLLRAPTVYEDLVK